MSQRLVSPLIVSTTEGATRMQMLGDDNPATEKVDTQRCPDLWEARS